MSHHMPSNPARFFSLAYIFDSTGYDMS
jgi:hypothetical protein